MRGGLALVSTVPPLRQVELREAPEYGDEEDGKLPRVAGIGMLLSTEDGTRFWVFNFHLKKQAHKEHKVFSSFLDAKQLMLEDPNVPAVFAGDFNRSLPYLQGTILANDKLALDATVLRSEKVARPSTGGGGDPVDYAFIARLGAPRGRKHDARGGGNWSGAAGRSGGRWRGGGWERGGHHGRGWRNQGRGRGGK